jgi:hydroxymethylbilane synthase
MLLKMASRKSDLARLQAYIVANELSRVTKRPIEHLFSSSFGDNNPDISLMNMPAKGVFTQDFDKGLKDSTFDLVVHSWKDLPTDLPETSVIYTLKRADPRDLLLCKKSSWDNIKDTKSLKILTSSPRRVHHLDQFIPSFFPIPIEHLTCHEVRGNIPTRIKKLIDGDEHALVVAKAAIDRLLNDVPTKHQGEFSEVQEQLRAYLNLCNFMVLPLAQFPTAAAQGALAIEVHRDRTDIREIVEKIHCSQTFEHVSKERITLSRFGGGCHQKLGMTSRPHPHGTLFSVSGKDPQNETIKSLEFKSSKEKINTPAIHEDELYPQLGQNNSLYERKTLEVELPLAPYLFVTKDSALPKKWNHQQLQEKVIWTSGLTTWRKLAKRGIWVHGSCESLGETDSLTLESIRGQKDIRWTKLTHKASPKVGPHEHYATYELTTKSTADLPDLKGKKHFYWMSGSQFKMAFEHEPSIKEAQHACGPGLSYDEITQHLSHDNPAQIYLNYEQWYESLTKKMTKK